MDQAVKQELVTSGGWRDWVCAEALTWKFTPYQHKGRLKKIGVDCGGLLYEIYSPLLGPFAPFPRDYPPDWAAHKGGNELYLDFIMPYVTQVPVAMRGGFSVFHYGRNFSHAAIWMGQRYLHAWGRNNVGYVKESPITFFATRAGVLRETKHFDVSKEWLCSLLP